MPNLLTLTTPIAVPDLKYAHVVKATEVDDSKKRLVLVLEFYGDDNVIHPNQFDVEVTNGRCTKLDINPTPRTTQDAIRSTTVTTADNEDLANAFDQVMYQYFSAGGLTAVLATLTALDLLPEGTAS